MEQRSNPGDEIQAYCTSCKTMQEHIVVASVDGKAAKVECTECHKQHLFRAGPPGTAKKASGTRARKSEPALPTVDVAALVAGRPSRAYDPKVRFAIGEVVKHPSFGVGIVTTLPGAQKMEVAFAGGGKLLSHDRDGAGSPSLTRPARRDDEDNRRVTDAPPDRPR